MFSGLTDAPGIIAEKVRFSGYVLFNNTYIYTLIVLIA